jgi:hypothetical protein
LQQIYAPGIRPPLYTSLRQSRSPVRKDYIAARLRLVAKDRYDKLPPRRRL